MPRFQRVIRYSLSGVKKAAYANVADASRKTGIHKNSIALAVKGKLKTSVDMFRDMGMNLFRQ